MNSKNYQNEIELSVNFLKKMKDTQDLPEQQLLDWAKQAIDIGAKYADAYKGKNVVNIAAKHNIKIETHKGGVFGTKLLRALYDDSVKSILIYQDGIQSVLDTGATKVLGIENTKEKVREMLLWHEFFHFLEFKQIGLVGKQFKLPKKIFFFNKNKSIYYVSEISANAFAKRVMNLKTSPFVVDFILHEQNNEKINNEEVEK